MTDAEIAEKVRTERRTLQGIVHELSRAASTMPVEQHGTWLNELRGRFEHFRAHIYKAMALQEQNGFLSHLLARRPTLEREVSRLKADHAQILALADDIYGRLEAIDTTQTLLIEECQLRIRHLLDQLARHDEQENLLVTVAFTEDISAGD